MKGVIEKRVVLTLAAMLVLAAAGVFAAVALAGGNTPGGTSGSATDDFTYDGQTISHNAYGPPWANGADSGRGWIKAPLSFDCRSGTLAMTERVQYTGDELTESFVPPPGTVIVGLLWATQTETNWTSASWVNDGSSASVTMAGSGKERVWSDSRIFYCLQQEGSTSTETTTVTTPGTTVTSPSATTTVTTPGSTATVTTPGSTTTFTPPPQHRHKKHHHRQTFTPPNVKLPHTS